MIDYEKWDKVDEFNLEQVACLWCDLEPSAESQSLRRVRHPATAKVEKMLWSAIQSKELPKKLPAVRRTRITSDAAAWFMTRDDLYEFAKRKGAKPAFLFPDARPSDERLKNSERPSYRSPYVDLILNAEQHFGERIREIKAQEIQDWLNIEGQKIDPSWSAAKANYMSTFLRHPDQQKGGAKPGQRSGPLNDKKSVG